MAHSGICKKRTATLRRQGKRFRIPVSSRYARDIKSRTGCPSPGESSQAQAGETQPALPQARDAATKHKAGHAQPPDVTVSLIAVSAIDQSCESNPTRWEAQQRRRSCDSVKTVTPLLGDPQGDTHRHEEAESYVRNSRADVGRLEQAQSGSRMRPERGGSDRRQGTCM